MHPRGDRVDTVLRHGCRTVLLALAIVSSVAATALAARPTRGALYKGSTFGVFAFQVSRDGRTMHFKGEALLTNTCKDKNGRFTGGGEEDLVESVVQPGQDPAPLVKIRSDGTFRGSGIHVFKPQAAPTETIRVEIVGRFTGSGKTGVGKVVTTLVGGSANGSCSTQQFTLKAH